jgi:hypothetical protein
VIITLGYSIEYGGRDGFIDDLYLIPEGARQRIGEEVTLFRTVTGGATWNRNTASRSRDLEPEGDLPISVRRIRGHGAQLDASSHSTLSWSLGDPARAAPTLKGDVRVPETRGMVVVR